jgi:hypothetical protein
MEWLKDALMATIPSRFSMMAPFMNAPQRFFRRRAQPISLSAAAVMGVVSLFSDGPAHAVVCVFSTSGSGCSYGDQWPGGGPIDLAAPGPLPPAITGPVIGQWLDTDIFPSTTETYYFPTDKQIKFVQFHDQAQGDLSWGWDDRDGSGTWRIPPDAAGKDIWAMNTSFYNSTIPASSQEYLIRITEPGYYFADAFLFANLSGTASVAKDIYTVSAGGPGTLIGTLTLDASATTPAVLAINNHQELYIIDRYTPGASGAIDGHFNGFTQAVPGPSPLIGAGAAIGFCRKLRRRVKGG